MKYCRTCGAELDDDARFCTVCGKKCDSLGEEKSEDKNILIIITKVFMILGVLSSAWAIIPLIWTVPMTIKYFKMTDKHQIPSVSFKICSLIFVSVIAGILMLCVED